MVVATALIDDTSRAVVLGDPLRVADAVGLVTPPLRVGVGVAARVRVGVTVLPGGVRVGVDGFEAP